jgi:hypothetical protein
MGLGETRDTKDLFNCADSFTLSILRIQSNSYGCMGCPDLQRVFHHRTVRFYLLQHLTRWVRKLSGLAVAFAHPRSGSTLESANEHKLKRYPESTVRREGLVAASDASDGRSWKSGNEGELLTMIDGESLVSHTAMASPP